MRSTFIVGFPGETDADFAYLLDWLDEAEIDRVGCFKYEPVAGAPSNALGNAVPDEVKAGALERADGAPAEDSAAPAEEQGRHAAAGHHRRGRPDRRQGPLERRTRLRSTARSIFSSRRPLRVGEIVTAKIERADEYDLHGSVAGFNCGRAFRKHPSLDIPAPRAYGPRHDLQPDPTPRHFPSSLRDDDGSRHVRRQR